MEKEDFRKLIDKLKGFNWCFISGMAVSIYTKGKRDYGDIDILIHKAEIDKFAEKIEQKVIEKNVKKGDITISDRRVEFDFQGKQIEVVTSFPNDKIQEESVQKMLDNKKEEIFLGEKAYVTPIEELIAQKASMQREKDISDLKLLKNLKLRLDLLKWFLKKWRNEKEAIHLLIKLGYKLK